MFFLSLACVFKPLLKLKWMWVIVAGFFIKVCLAHANSHTQWYLTLNCLLDFDITKKTKEKKEQKSKKQNTHTNQCILFEWYFCQHTIITLSVYLSISWLDFCNNNIKTHTHTRIHSLSFIDHSFIYSRSKTPKHTNITFNIDGKFLYAMQKIVETKQTTKIK